MGNKCYEWCSKCRHAGVFNCDPPCFNCVIPQPTNYNLEIVKKKRGRPRKNREKG